MSCSAILLAGGSGTRLNSKKEKQFLKVGGKPLLYYSLKLLIESGYVEELIIVYKKGTQNNIKKIVQKYFKNINPIFIEGGKIRQESVYNGLKNCKYDKIILHESARPFVTKVELDKIFRDENENVTLGYPIPFTVLKKSNSNLLNGILNREDLFNVQLPQKFNRKKFLLAHQKAKKEKKIFTDDSSLLYYYGDTVKIITGEDTNIKVTTSLDLIYSKQILKKIKGKI